MSKNMEVDKDMEDYVKQLTANMEVESVLDVGTGNKGVVAQHYWEKVKKIKRGYACDIWIIKPLPPVWKPLKMSVFNIPLKPKSVDVVQAFGFLEHLEKLEGYRFLKMAESLARKLVIVSAAHWLLIGKKKALRKTVIGSPDLVFDLNYKASKNPYHMYKSTWNWLELEELGFETNFEDAFSGLSFASEVIAWKKLWSTA